MPKQKATIDEIRRDVGRAMLSCLNDYKYTDITFDVIAAAVSHDAPLIRRLFPDMTKMVYQGLRDLDDEIAEIKERILEGLIVRYEAYRPFKAAIKNLNVASVSNPVLASVTIQRLSDVSRTILELSGDDTSGILGLLRVKGLAGVALSAQREWFRDETSDMSSTIRVLDQRLNQAEELAETLNIILRQ